MSRRRSSNQSNLLGLLLIIGSIVAAAAIGVYVAVTRPPTFAPELCGPNGPKGVVAIAIDATDQLGEAQRLAIKNSLLSAVDGLPETARIELWTVAPSAGVPRRVGRVFCKPAVAKEVSELTRNPKLAEAAEKAFLGEFSTALDSVLSQLSSNASPIIETLQAIDVRSFSTVELKKVASKRVILVSDLVQNTTAISLLAELPAPTLPKGMAISLQDVEVDIVFIDRTPAAYGRVALLLWWQTMLFQECGAQIKRVERI